MLEIEKIVMAHRYLYYVTCEPVLSDYDYDLLENQALKVAKSNSPINNPGSSLDSSYSQEIKDLAMNLSNPAVKRPQCPK